MTACRNRQTTKGGTPLVCACDTDIVGSTHIHKTADGVRFIGALGIGGLGNVALVLGVRQ